MRAAGGGVDRQAPGRRSSVTGGRVMGAAAVARLHADPTFQAQTALGH
jgi:hypothetical protein